MASWDPGQYAKFAGPRLRPAADLVARLPDRQYGSAVDLGCGGGQVTGLLHARFPALQLTGIDNSPAMLDVARQALPEARFALGDIGDSALVTGHDLVVSNAAFHWLPDHRAILGRIVRALPAGGVLAVQMPRNHSAPSHQCLAETVDSPRWENHLGRVQGIRPVDDAHVYASLLLDAGAATVDAWSTRYVHVLEPAPRSHPVLEWTKGTALRPYLDVLDEDAAKAFIDDYRSRLEVAYPARPGGRVIFPFRRVFMVAQK